MLKAPAIVAWLWIAFVLYWLVLAQFNKKVSRSTPWFTSWGLRLAIIIGVLVVMPFRRHGVADLIASLGRSLPDLAGLGGQWLGVGLCLAGLARTEEKMMLAQFPDAYPAYRLRTKMLIPFVF